MADGKTFVDTLERDNYWTVRLATNEVGNMCFIIGPKLFSGYMFANMILNVALSMSINDFMGILAREKDTTNWDIGLTLLTIFLCYYDYRKRRRKSATEVHA